MHDLWAFDADFARLAQRHRLARFVQQFHVRVRQGQACGAAEILNAGGIERHDRAGLRETIAFADEGASDGFPAVRGGPQHGCATAAGQAQIGEVHLANAGVHAQAGVQGVHAHEDAEP